MQNNTLPEVNNDDLAFVRKILPSSYRISVGSNPRSIRCISDTGILKDIDAEDDEHWGYVMNGFRQYFGDRFEQVNHNVCFGHTDFIIWLTGKKAMI